MICYLAPVTVSMSAFRAVVSSDVFLITAREKVVTILLRTVKIFARVAGISDHFPLKSLHLGNFILSQELFEVNFGRECYSAFHVGAHYRNFALVNMRAHVLGQAFAVIDVARGTNGV